MKNYLYPTIFLVILGLLVLFMVRGFLSGIISAFVIAFFMLPIFRWINKKVPKTLAAMAIIFSLILLLFIVISYISMEITRQALEYIGQEDIKSTASIFLANLPFKSPALYSFIDTFSAKMREVLISVATSFVANLPAIAINVLLTFFLSYYLLVHWNEAAGYMRKVIPIREESTLKRLHASFYNIFYGLSIIAIIEFFISLVGFWLAGVPLFLFLALLVAISAFVPMFGPVTIWLPLFLYYILAGNMYAAIIILITGLIMTLIIDNFVVNIVVGKTANINPAFMILGILGGMGLFGFFGFILGPLLMITFFAFLEEYVEDYTGSKVKQ
jgi:predicted PurR-regulated permease PerM